MLEKMLRKVEIRGKRFTADRMYDIIWLEEYLSERGIEVVIKRKKNSKRKGVDEVEYRDRNTIEGMFGNMKRKLDGVVYVRFFDIQSACSFIFAIYFLIVCML